MGQCRVHHSSLFIASLSHICTAAHRPHTLDHGSHQQDGGRSGSGPPRIRIRILRRCRCCTQAQAEAAGKLRVRVQRCSTFARTWARARRRLACARTRPRTQPQPFARPFAWSFARSCCLRRWWIVFRCCRCCLVAFDGSIPLRRVQVDGPQSCCHSRHPGGRDDRARVARSHASFPPQRAPGAGVRGVWKVRDKKQAVRCCGRTCVS